MNQVPSDFYKAVRARLTDVSRSGDKRQAVAALIAKLRPQARTLDGLPHAARTLLEPTRPKHGAAKPRLASGDADLIAMLKRLAAHLAEAQAE